MDLPTFQACFLKWEGCIWWKQKRKQQKEIIIYLNWREFTVDMSQAVVNCHNELPAVRQSSGLNVPRGKGKRYCNKGTEINTGIRINTHINGDEACEVKHLLYAPGECSSWPCLGVSWVDGVRSEGWLLPLIIPLGLSHWWWDCCPARVAQAWDWLSLYHKGEVLETEWWEGLSE